MESGMPDDKMTELILKDVTFQIIAAVIEVHKILGYGFLENVYEKALLKELRLRGLKAVTQKEIKVIYKDEEVGSYFADIVVNDDIILELKSVELSSNRRRQDLAVNILHKIYFMLVIGAPEIETGEAALVPGPFDTLHDKPVLEQFADITAPNESAARLWLGGDWILADRCPLFGHPAEVGNWDGVVRDAQAQAAKAFDAMMPKPGMRPDLNAWLKSSPAVTRWDVEPPGPELTLGDVYTFTPAAL
jgi:GxxExxY protein